MIRLASDLHLEFHLEQFIADNADYSKKMASTIFPNLPTDKETVLVLAGDIILIKNLEVYFNFFEILSEQFKEVLWIFGNHEWFKNKMKPERLIEIKQKMAVFKNVHVLENEIFETEKYHFIATTLWSDIKKGDYMTALDVVSVSYDFKKIDFKEGHRYSKLRPRHVTKMFMDNERFIRDELLKIKDSQKIKVVVTHHPPTIKALTDRMLATPDYWSDFGNVDFGYLKQAGIEPDFWLHGHVHESQHIPEGKTMIISNARGYDELTASGKPMINSNYTATFIINPDNENK